MAADEAVKKVQQEVRGLEYLSIKEGKKRFMEELVYGCNYPESLFFGQLGEANLPLGQLEYFESDLFKMKKMYNDDGFIIDRVSYPLIDSIIKYNSKEIFACKELDLKKDIHLNDHLVNGDHVFAGVMHVEAACELCEIFLKSNNISDYYKIEEISDFNFEKFIKVYKDKTLKLNYFGKVIEKDNDKLILKVEISSDFVNNCGKVLIKDRLHSYGYIVANKIEKQNNIKKFGKDIKHLMNGAKKLNDEKYYENAKNFITFGEKFRCIDEVKMLDENELIGSITVPEDGEIFSFIMTGDTIISPITIDNVGRYMLFNEFHKNGNTIIPVKIEKAKQKRRLNAGEKIYVYCKKLNEEDSIVTYNAKIVDEKNNIVFDIEKMNLIKIGKNENNYSLI